MSSENSIKYINANSKTVETELLRQQLYNKIIDKVSEKLKKYLQQKEIQHFILRYVFNKIIERRSENDPVFIPEYSEICYLQVQKDHNKCR